MAQDHITSPQHTKSSLRVDPTLFDLEILFFLTHVFTYFGEVISINNCSLYTGHRVT